MTSQSSASSLAKHRQSWLDLVSQASPSAGETAVVCSVQVHSRQSPRGEAEGLLMLESSGPQDSTETASTEGSLLVEAEAKKDVLNVKDEGMIYFLQTFH